MSSLHNNGRLSNLPPPPGPTYILPPPPPPRRTHIISTTTTTHNCNTHYSNHHIPPIRPPKSSSMTLLTQSTTETATMYYNYHNKHRNHIIPPHTGNRASKSCRNLPTNHSFFKKRQPKNLSNTSSNSLFEKSKSDIMFFAAMNGIETYSVIYYTNLCGLELYPNDTVHGIGAKIIKCHNVYRASRVLINSLLIGINDKIVLNVNY
eukprot:UN04045